MREDEALTDGDIATAALQWTAALVHKLIEKGLLTPGEAAEISESAQRQCEAEGVAHAATILARLTSAE
jgi:hypothetical protein